MDNIIRDLAIQNDRRTILSHSKLCATGALVSLFATGITAIFAYKTGNAGGAGSLATAFGATSAYLTLKIYSSVENMMDTSEETYIPTTKSVALAHTSQAEFSTLTQG